MAEQLESKSNKFKEEMRNHPGRFLARTLFEPGYILRTVSSIHKESKKDPPIGLYVTATVLEGIRLGVYAFYACKIAEHFIK